MIKHCDEVFSKKHKVSPIKSAKALYKLREAAEKCKKILSANLDATIHVDCLVDDDDITVNFKRDQFEGMSAQVFQRFETLFSRFKARLAQEKLTFKSLELVGGSCRIPKLQELVSKVFETNDLKKTLNFDECISQGASIMAAVVSPFYSVQSTKLKDSFPHQIKLFDVKTPDKV